MTVAEPADDAWAEVTAWAAHGGNPASLHQLGQAVRRAIEAAGQAVAAAVGLPGADVVWLPHVAAAHRLALAAHWARARAAGARRLSVHLPEDGAFAEARAWAAANGLAVDAQAPSAGPCLWARPVHHPSAWTEHALHEDWPGPPTHRSVAVAGWALGGPLGIAALVGSGAEAPAGTRPREIIVAMGLAARRLANGG